MIRLAAALHFAAFWIGGCAAPGTVHPEFARLKPESVAVFRPANETVHPLDQVAVGGLAQRTVFGSRMYDVLDILRGGFEEAVIQRGYALFPPPPGKGPADFREPPPAGAAPPAFDAALFAVVESWRADLGSNTTVSMRYRVEMRHAATAAVLYSGTFHLEHRDDPGGRGGVDFTDSIRRSARRALGALPPAKE